MRNQLRFTARDKEGIADGIKSVQDEILTAKLERLGGRIGLARADRAEDVAAFMEKVGNGATYEYYCLQRKHTLVTSSAYTVGSSSGVIYPWERGNGQISPAPAGEVVIFDQITFILHHDITVATMAELMEELLVLVYFAQSNRKPLTLPFSQFASSWIEDPIAGTAASDDSLVAGNRPRVRYSGRSLKLDADSPLVVMPQDTVPRIEFAWNPDYTANTAAAGSESALDIAVLFEGERIKV